MIYLNLTHYAYITSLVLTVAAQRIFVDAAPVTCTFNPPFVVSADKAIAHADAPDV